jgi:hypothetical protein
LKTIRATLVVLLAFGPAAARDRNWETGKVTAARTVSTGARSAEAWPSGPYGPPPPIVTRTTTAAELQIFGDVYAYTARDLGTGSLVRHPCRYIVGDPVKYVQEGRVLFLIDADGRECRAAVMVQERIPVEKAAAKQQQ